MGFGDINSLIKFRDAKPAAPLKAVFMLYNRPPFAIIGRKSRGISEPKDLEGKTLGAPPTDSLCAVADIRAGERHRCLQGNDREVSFPVREPMLAAGQVDAIAGLSFSSFIDLKEKGVPVDDVCC